MSESHPLVAKRWTRIGQIVLFVAMTVLFQVRVHRFLPFTGDEPHYVLTVYSLLRDGDFNLANNYTNGDAALIGRPRLTPQAPPSRPGLIIPPHGIGFPLLVALPYALLGQSYCRILLVALMAIGTPLLVAATAEALTGSLLAGTGAGLMLSGSATWQLYASRYLPECGAGLLCAAVLYLLVRRLSNPAAMRRPFAAWLTGAMVAYLPFLYVKYAVLGAALLTACLTRPALRRNSWFYAGFGCVAALAVVFTTWTYGLTLGVGPGVGFKDFTSSRSFERFCSLWIDRGHGLAVMQPVFLLGLWAVPSFFGRLRKTASGLLLWAAAAITAYAVLYAFFIGNPGASAPGRFLCSAEPLLAILIVQWASAGGPFQRVREGGMVILLGIGTVIVLLTGLLGKAPWAVLTGYQALYPYCIRPAGFVLRHFTFDPHVMLAPLFWRILALVAFTKLSVFAWPYLQRLVPADSARTRALVTALEKWDNAPLIMTAAFMVLVLAVNFQIFTRPIVESGDFAANSLLVQQAEHFRLLTGHYSRWHFMHPGPAFMYLFALGEFLFYDLLHVVPAPFNGQLLIAILFNGALLYAALHVFRKHTKLPVPLALFATLLVTVMVNVTGPPSMLVSNWMPDVLLFPFLLFTVSCASVLAGETGDLPLASFAGMLLIHAHVAQFLFAGLIGGGTVAYILVRAQRQGELRRFMLERWRAFALAAAVLVVFSVPPLLELVVDRPNNLDALLAYYHQFGGARNNIGMAIGYLACFLLFIGDPDAALRKGPAGILSVGLSPTSVVLYWLMLGLLVVFVISRRSETRQALGLFLKYLAWIVAASVLLFLYWSTRITGGFYAFNGRFFDALHLAAWLLLLAAVEPFLEGRILRSLNACALVCLVIVGIAERRALLSASGADDPEARQAAAAAPDMPFGALAVTSDPADWPRAIGVANSMQRMGKAFCVGPSWSFVFSRAHLCPDILAADKLSVATTAAPCMPPCRYVYRGASIWLTRIPAESLALPLKIGVHESMDVERTDFYATEGSFCWTRKHASLLFLLSPGAASAPCYRLAIAGHAFPGRPMRLGVNGQFLGTWSKSEPDTGTFVVPRPAIHAGGRNLISLDTPNAGPVGSDPREIGFAFSGLTLRAAGAGESCTVDPANQPSYESISVEWAPSCYALEGTPPDQWRWCGPDSLVVIHNTSRQSRPLTLSAGLSTGQDKAAPLKIHSPFFDDTLEVSRQRLAYTRTFTVPPGDHTIAFSCRAARSGAPDPRNLVLRFDNFRLEPAAAFGLKP